MDKKMDRAIWFYLCSIPSNDPMWIIGDATRALSGLTDIDNKAANAVFDAIAAERRRRADARPFVYRSSDGQCEE